METLLKTDYELNTINYLKHLEGLNALKLIKNTE